MSYSRSCICTVGLLKREELKQSVSERVSTQWTVCENWWVASEGHPSVFLCCSSEFASIHPLTWGRPRPGDQSGCSQMKELCSTLRVNTLPVLIRYFVDRFFLRWGFTAKCFGWRTAGNWATSPVWNRKESLYTEPMVCVCMVFGCHKKERFYFHCVSVLVSLLTNAQCVLTTNRNVFFHCHFSRKANRRQRFNCESDSWLKHVQDMFCHFAQAMTGLQQSWNCVCCSQTHAHRAEARKNSRNNWMHTQNVITWD